MSKILVLALILSVAAVAQQTHPDPTINTDLPGSIEFSISPPEHYVSIMTTGPSLILIQDKNHELMVRVDVDGKVELGKDYKPDDGARAFWSELAKAYFGVCSERAKESTKSKPVKGQGPDHESK